MSNENELLEPLATEAGQQAIVRAIRDISSLEYAVRAEQAASTASAKAGEASQSAIEASEAEDKAKDWATKTDGYVEQETITIPPEQEGEEPTIQTTNLYSAKYYAAQAQDIYNNMSFDQVPTENSGNMVSSGVVYSALDLKADKSTTYTKTEVDTQISTAVSNLVNSAPSTLDTLEELADALGDDPNFATTIATQLGLKADKSDTYTKTEVDTALSNVQSTLTFDNAPTANSDNPVKSSGIKTALDAKQDTLTFDSTPTANSTNPVTSGGIYTALVSKADQSSVPTKVSDLTNDSGFITGVAWNDVTSKPTFATVATSGSYTDLDDKPTIPSAYTLPTASANTLGGIKVGTNLSIDNNGVLSASGGNNVTVDSSITENSTNPVTSAAIYEALQNFTPSGGGGGAGNASGVVEDTLFESSTGVNSGTINLSGNISDYDLIAFQVWTGQETYACGNPIIQVSTLLKFKDKGGGYRVGADRAGLGVVCINVISDNQFNLIEYTNNAKIYKITGIKFSKNLSEQMYSNVLYENSSGWSSGNASLNDNIDNYDFIEFIYGESSYPLQRYSMIFGKEELLNYINNSNRVVLDGASDRYFVFTVSSATQLSYYANGNNVVYKIIGHKMAKGGYSGIVSDARMTVKSGTVECSSTLSGGSGEQISVTFDNPMPDTNYTVSFCSLSQGAYSATLFIRVDTKTVNGFVCYIYNTGNGTTTQKPKYDWIAIRSNSYTREGMVEDVLFSNASGVNSGTINLSGNISDYDLICFVYNTNGGSSNLFKQHYYINPSNLSVGDKVSLTGYDNRYIDVQLVSDQSLSITGRNEHTLIKIIGIKFGRYVSGVAVDTTVTQNSNAVVTSGAVYDALQNAGGGSSITVDSTITQGGTNPVEGGAIYTALASKGDVTTNTDQNITGTKTFVGSKKVAFKQSTANDKLGFTLYGNTGTERGYLEFNPTNTVDGVAGLMTLGNYATSAASLTQVGFRRYSNISGASGAYNLLMPMVADARTPFSLTTTYQNFYLPLGFTDGTTTVKTAKSGLVDLSPLLASLEARIAALEGN